MVSVTRRLGVPAYAYPHTSSGYWAQLANAAPAVGMVIANPSNGPGTAADPNYVMAIQLIRSRGICLAGYVSTAYGNRPLADVLVDVRSWYDWYRIDGVFVDEVSPTEATWAYYQAIFSFIRTKDTRGRVVLNPGTQAPEQYMEICDVLLSYEGTWTTYQNGYVENPAWVTRYSHTRFWHIVHSCPTAAAMRTTLALSRTRNAGWLFVTPGSGPNPYERLPTGRYWADELTGTAKN
ncbi:MAG: spherulation-specific family 4 protein [Chloroflexota bacterium]|nr:spherulation-specific family 4 protein [Chloroflexota bacterium]